MGDDRLVKWVVVEAGEMAQENWLAEGFRARFRGVWLERVWCRRPGEDVFDGNRTYAERHCMERGEEGVGS